MRKVFTRAMWWSLAVVVAGGVLLSVGCDANTKAALEDGVISASSSLVGAVLQALIGLFNQQQTQTTAQAVMDSALRLFA